LFAYLLLGAAPKDGSVPVLRSVAGVFAYLLDRFLESKREANQSGTVPPISPRSRPALRRYLADLAFRMTKGNVVQAPAAHFEQGLPPNKRRQFKAFLGHLIGSGLLRGPGDRFTWHPEARAPELRQLTIAFLHQSFQEYLTARHLLDNPDAAL